MAKTGNITLTKYIAEDGMYFCNIEQKIVCTQLFLGKNDSIENWLPEIDEEEKSELERQWKAEAENMEQEGQDAQNA